MKIAVCGKGGVGKTTISGVLCRVLGRMGYPVLAIDGDPNPNLSIVLGLKTEMGQATPLSTQVLEKVEEPDGKKYIKLGIPLSELIEKYAVQAPDNVTLLMVGQPEHAGTGCMCGSHTTVREIVHAALEDNAQITVLDMEASLEHMKRGTSKYVDVLFAIVEPYYRSLEAAGRFYRLATELGIGRVAAIANKIKTQEEEEAVRQYCARVGLPLEIVIPFDPQITAADHAGLSILDYHANSEAVNAIRKLGNNLMALTSH